MNLKLYLDLFWTFAKIGVCTFGGGYAMLPILQRELVDKRGWVTEEALADCYAVGQCTPGVIAVNTATFVGFWRGGNLGGVIATLGVVLPSVVIIMAVAAFLAGFAHLPVVAHAFAGVRACVCALIFSSVIKLVKGAVVDVPALVVFLAVLALAVAGGFVDAAGSAVLGVLFSPVFLVVAAGLAGLGVRVARGWRK